MEKHLVGDQQIQRRYELARECYGALGVDTEAAISRLGETPISLHCWQGDDVIGFEGAGEAIGGGLAVTGNYPGRARNPLELRADVEQAMALIPSPLRFNLHASYGEFGKSTDRDQIDVGHFRGWMDWSNSNGVPLDFNPTFFAHPRATDGWTLAHPDPTIRRFWISHGIATRRIAAAMGRNQSAPCINNVWIPDGSKDTPANRRGPRERLAESLDQMFAEELNAEEMLDAVECKLFGIGSESYVAGSHEFYLGYAITRQKVLCLDAGHFHPTELISDKISSALLYVPRLLLHVSRGIRWDSDHVVTFTDELQAITHEIVRGDYLDRVHLGLDFFDASINRVAAWVIGARNLSKAMLMALLEPLGQLKEFERLGDLTGRLALMEECKSLPFAAVWDYYCLKNDVPVGIAWLDEVRQYEHRTLPTRS